MAYMNITRFHVLCFCAWQLCIFSACQQIFPIFMNYSPKWACQSKTSMENNTNVSYLSSSLHYSKNCTLYETCVGDADAILLFEESPFYSAIMEFEMQCGPLAYMSAMMSTLQFFGVLIGTICWGHAGDRFGRRPVGMTAATVLLITGSVSGFVQYWQVLAGMRFLTGFSLAGCIVVTFAHVVEMVRPEQRILLRTIFNWGIARTLFTLLNMAVPRWRSAVIAHCCLTGLPLLLIIGFFLPESPKWLESKGDWVQMDKAKRWIDRVNGHKPQTLNGLSNNADSTGQFLNPQSSDGSLSRTSSSANAESTQNGTSPVKLPLKADTRSRDKISTVHYTIKDLFASRELTIRTLVFWSMWFTAAFCSFAIDLNSRNLAGDFYVNQLLFCCVILLSKWLLFFIDTYIPAFKRRTLHQGALSAVIASFGAILALTFVEHEYSARLTTVLSFVGTVSIEYTWDACYLCSAEGYPTVIRSIGVGSASLMARVGALFAPQLAYLSVVWPPALSAVIMGLCTVTLTLSYLYLPETSGVELAVRSLHDEEIGMKERHSRRNTDA